MNPDWVEEKAAPYPLEQARKDIAKVNPRGGFAHQCYRFILQRVEKHHGIDAANALIDEFELPNTKITKEVKHG